MARPRAKRAPVAPPVEPNRTYRVIGSQAINGVPRGGLVTLPDAQASRLLRAGSVSLDTAPASDDTVSDEVETSDAVSDSDATGHQLPENER